MLAELSIEPIADGDHMASALARTIDLITQSGLDYEVTAMGTLVEGTNDQIWDLLRRCHDRARHDSQRVITEIRIDDRGDKALSLHRNVSRIEEVLGKSVKKSA